jgi:hypothetical protein
MPIFQVAQAVPVLVWLQAGLVAFQILFVLNIFAAVVFLLRGWERRDLSDDQLSRFLTRWCAATPVRFRALAIPSKTNPRARLSHCAPSLRVNS